MNMDRDTSSPGQGLEFEIWAALMRQSQGTLYLFLPLLDRGLDAVVHRMTDGRYIPIQIKGRGEAVEGMVEIVVRGDSLVDDSALLIGSFMRDIPDQLDLVVEEGIFKKLAAHNVSQGHEFYSAAFSMHPNHSHWRPYLVPRSQLAERILGKSVAAAVTQFEPYQLEPSERHNAWLGFLGEAEGIRRLAQSPRLDLFRPFPDLEMVEVLARDHVTGGFAGLQGKTATVAHRYGEAQIHVHKATLTAAATTWLVGLAWLDDADAFHDECLLVPAADIPEIAVDGEAVLRIKFPHASPQRTPREPDPS